MKNMGEYQPFLPWENIEQSESYEYRPDDRSGNVYLEEEKLRFITEVAIVTQRPLLLRGEPGSGKSSFAPFVARNLNWRYYEQTVTARTEAKDLLWRFDALRRLRDAHSNGLPNDLSAARYVTPGPLWWAFNRAEALKYPLGKSSVLEPLAELNQSRDPLRAVVLIDEIDKADPNLPNDLLEVLGTNCFQVDDADLLVTRLNTKEVESSKQSDRYGSLLIVITTNEERDLPEAFLRRCVVYTIDSPSDTKRLMDIAWLHMKSLIEQGKDGKEMLEQIAETCLQLRKDAMNKQRRGPSIAEFLDAVRFCLVRGLTPESEEWKIVQQSVLLK